MLKQHEWNREKYTVVNIFEHCSGRTRQIGSEREKELLKTGNGLRGLGQYEAAAERMRLQPKPATKPEQHQQVPEFQVQGNEAEHGVDGWQKEDLGHRRHGQGKAVLAVQEEEPVEFRLRGDLQWQRHHAAIQPLEQRRQQQEQDQLQGGTQPRR